MDAPLALVTGVGPGTGVAVVRRLVAGGYRVAMIARDRERLARFAAEIDGALPFPCDVCDPAQLDATLEAIRASLGAPSVLVHNAVGGAFGSFLDVDPAVLEHNFQVNVMALLRLARALAPDMVAAGNGAIVVTGNTSARRGAATFAAFAPSKAAQRILAESMARSLGPKGIHVAYVVVDAVIDVPWTRQAFAGRPDEFFAQPAAIADTVYHVAHQDRSAWTFDVDLRPFGEKW
jgi:NAD(P)-dependent dehydrogenase (short-subunit alcohol dehydrogenase family)